MCTCISTWASGPTYHCTRCLLRRKERKRKGAKKRKKKKKRRNSHPRDPRIGFQSKLINMRLVILPSLFSPHNRFFLAAARRGRGRLKIQPRSSGDPVGASMQGVYIKPVIHANETRRAGRTPSCTHARNTSTMFSRGDFDERWTSETDDGHHERRTGNFFIVEYVGHQR